MSELSPIHRPIEKTFEGTYCIKEFKNDNGTDYPFTVDCNDEKQAKDILEMALNKYVEEKKFFSWKINQITERK